MKGLYLLRKREFDRSGEDIYKFGKSDTIKNRIRNYDKLSKLYMVIICNNNRIIEKEILNIFKNTLEHDSTYGRESFKGKLDKFIEIIVNYMKNKDCTIYKFDGYNTNDFNYEILNDNNIIEKKCYNLSKKFDNSQKKIDISQKKCYNLSKKFDNSQYICKLCNFSTHIKTNYTKHLTTQKHSENYKKKVSEENKKKYIRRKLAKNDQLDTNIRDIGETTNVNENIIAELTKLRKQIELLEISSQELKEVTSHKTNKIEE